MSLILEALRKSEAERRRGQSPDVTMELPPVPRHHGPTQRWWFPALSVGVLGLVGVVWLRQAATDNPPPTLAEPAPVAMLTPAPVAAAAPVPAISAAPLVIPRQPPPATPTPAASASPAPATSAAAPTRVRSAPTTHTPEIAATALLPVKLSMHLWNAVPAKRFVILNGQRMGEGERFGDLSVVAIDRNGVTIERNGQRAHIPLP